MYGDNENMMGEVDFDTRFCEFEDEEKEVYIENDSGGHSNHRRMRNCGLMTPIDELSQETNESNYLRPDLSGGSSGLVPDNTSVYSNNSRNF